jgi:hypothetical protein
MSGTRIYPPRKFAFEPIISLPFSNAFEPHHQLIDAFARVRASSMATVKLDCQIR